MGRLPGVYFPLFKNALVDEIEEIEKFDKENLRQSLGVRIGVVNENEIYYWTSDILHVSVEKRLKKDFKYRLVYDKTSNKIVDFSNVYDETDIPLEVEKKLRFLFPKAGITISKDVWNEAIQNKFKRIKETFFDK
jgi:hypothetical protein